MMILASRINKQILSPHPIESHRLRLLDEMSKSQVQADVKSFGAAMSGLDLLVECYEGRCRINI